MGIWAIVIGIALILAAGYEAYSVMRSFKRLHTSGNAGTSPFIISAYAFGFIIAIFLLIAGIGIFTFY